jgi:hypothetical protein
MTSRHLTTAVTLLVLLGILALGAVVGVKQLFQPVPDSGAAAPSASPSCTTTVLKKGQRLRSRQVVVSVFNAGTRAGLAEKTLSKLAKRGFQEGDVGNAPRAARLRFVQVWTTKKDDPAAKLVARQFGTKTRIKVTKRDLGEGIDVLVGNGFSGLAKAPRSIQVRAPQQICLPTSS